jgi:hypothetical protein
MSIRRPRLSIILWALFWIGVIMWVLDDPTGAAHDVRSLAAWAMGGAEKAATFLRTLATG